MRKNEEQALALRWSGRIALRHRILAVNIFAIVILAGSLFYLDGFRRRLTEARVAQVASEATMIADMLADVPRERRHAALVRLGRTSGTRLRIYGTDGSKQTDSWDGVPPTYELRDPAAEPWNRDLARWLDNALDALVGANSPPPLVIPLRDVAHEWPEAVAALRQSHTVPLRRRTAEGTLYVSAAAPIAGSEADPGREVLLLTVNARDIRRIVRDER